MLKVPQPPRTAAETPSTSSVKLTGSTRRATATRAALASASSTTPAESRRTPLRALGAASVASSSKQIPSSSKAGPSTSAGGSATARKASGTSGVIPEANGALKEPRRARRSSAVEKDKAGGEVALTRSISARPASSRLPPPVPATSVKRAPRPPTPSRRTATTEAPMPGSADPSSTPRARRVASGSSTEEARPTRPKRSLGAGDMGPPPPPSALAKKSSTTTIGSGILPRPLAASVTSTTARKASRPSLSSSASRPPRQTPSKPVAAPRSSQILSSSTAARPPPPPRSSSIPIAASGSVRMAKTSSRFSSHSIEEAEKEHGGGRSGKSSVTSTASTSRLGRSTSSSARPSSSQVNQSPTRLPTRRPDSNSNGHIFGLRQPNNTASDAEIRPRPPVAAPPIQTDRRGSWETLPPSARPSLSGAPLQASHGPSFSLSRPDGDSYRSQDHEGDVSWETVESRRGSALDASIGYLDSYQTPRKADHGPLSSNGGADLTSSLPARGNSSYVSPDASALHQALSAHQLSLVHTSTSPSGLLPTRHLDPRLTSLSPPELTHRLRGRESATLDEILKMSLMSAQKGDGGGDDGWLYEEGVSTMMRADLDGVSTPLKRSMVERTIEEDEEELWRDDALEARARVQMLEKEMEARSADQAAERVRELRRWTQEMEELRRASEAQAALTNRQHEDDLRRWQDERSALSSQLVQIPTHDDLRLQLASHQASTLHSSLVDQLEGIASRAKGDREELSSALSSLRLISAGLAVWSEVLTVL